MHVSLDDNVEVEFTERAGVPFASNLCIMVSVRNARGVYSRLASWNGTF